MSSNNRRNNYRNYNRPRWEVEKQEAEKARLEQMKRNMENTEENFPGLGRVTTKPPTVWGGRKFSELATDWKKDEDAKIEEEERRKQKTNVTEDGVFLLPRFNPTHRFVEQEADAQPAETTEVKPAVDNDDDETGWVTIDRNAEKQARIARKVRRMEERLQQMDNGEESSSSDEDAEEQDNTCWDDQPPEHETCWDDQRRRR